MRRNNPININTQTLWNGIYGDRVKYVTEQTGETMRFNRTLQEVKDGDKFLDIGCGVGVLTTMVKGTYPNCEVWGTDISDKAMHENTLENPQIKYLHQYVGNQDNLPDNYFDVVFSGEVLEHLDDPNDLFKDAKRVVKQGGKFIVTTPNDDAIRSDEHTWFYTHDDIEKLYKDNGFSRPRFVFLPNLEHTLVIYAIGRKL